MQGYSAPGRKIAINPLAQLPHKTLFHELAHQVLGHVGDQALVEVERLPKNLREVEAESVALICCEALALEGAPYCRGYIQAWLAGDEIPKRSAQRIFAAAEKILRAGTQRDLFAWSARVAPTLRRSDPLGYRTTALQARRKVFLEEHVGQRIRDLRKAKRIRQKTLARIVGISPGALTNFEKGRRRISIDWLQKIAEALDTPLAYFLDGDRRGRSKIVPGDPREKRLIQAWRSLGKQPTLRADFLRLVEHLRGRPRR
jgi:transcriptional regulator with XRE-family HTH domain